MVVGFGGSAARRAATSPSGYGVVSWPRGVSRSTSPSSSRSATAASIPSIDVPDMSPTTITGAASGRDPGSWARESPADDSAGLLEAGPGGGGVEAGEEGDDGGLHVAAGGLKGRGGPDRRAARGGGHDAAGPVHE